MLRIISQDGTTDIPYDSCILEIELYPEGAVIAFFADNGNKGFLGVYSSTDIAKEVLKSIRIKFDDPNTVYRYFIMPEERDLL